MDGGATNNSEAAGSRADIVYTGLRRAIIEGAVRPGTKLPEDSVGESFGVSRTIVRSVLARLASEGLVSQQPKRQASVAVPTLEDARDLFRVRKGVERIVVEVLSEGLSRDRAERLLAHVEAEHAANGLNEATSIALAGEFHILLARLTGNETLYRYVNELVSRCSLVLAIYGRPHSADCAISEHRQLIAAIADGQTQRAVELMDGHLDSVASRALLQHRPARDLDLATQLRPYAPPPVGVAIAAPSAPARRRGKAS
jgi:DNA-binding GntR family transcriptional regulator